MATIRSERVASVIKERIGAVLVHDYNDPAYGFITVTDVKMTPDLRIAKVYFSILGNEETRDRGMKMLEREKQHIRGDVAAYVRLRFAPVMQFYLDETMERVDRINQLINKIHEQDAKGSADAGGHGPKE
jgi:ribosome-binding factor A